MSATWATLASGWPARPAHGRAASAANLPRSLLRAGRYPAFPNPHIRTNAFMLERQRLLDLRWPETTRKSQAYELESGNEQHHPADRGAGLRALVVGRDGRAYDPDGWRDSPTFRAAEQANLLVGTTRHDTTTRRRGACAGSWPGWRGGKVQACSCGSRLGRLDHSLSVGAAAQPQRFEEAELLVQRGRRRWRSRGRLAAPRQPATRPRKRPGHGRGPCRRRRRSSR